MVPLRQRVRGLDLACVLACCAAACFNPTGADTTAAGSSGGATSTTTGAQTTGASTSDASSTTMTATSSTTEVDSTSGTSTDATSTTAPASTTEPASTGETTVDNTTGQRIECADGVYTPGVEECDDGNLEPNDGCDSNCKRTEFVVFLTNKKVNGALGGTAGADLLCQTEAVQANRQGIFRAWLSTDAVSASARLSHANLPYVLADGTPVAFNWVDLIMNGPSAPINTDASGNPILAMMPCTDDLVWTGTDKAGESVNKLNCDDWTVGIGNTGNVGSFQASGVSPAWSMCNSFICSTQAHLYCFEQPLG